MRCNQAPALMSAIDAPTSNRNCTILSAHATPPSACPCSTSPIRRPSPSAVQLLALPLIASSLGPRAPLHSHPVDVTVSYHPICPATAVLPTAPPGVTRDVPPHLSLHTQPGPGV